MSLSSPHCRNQSFGVLQQIWTTPSWLPRRESLLPTVLYLFHPPRHRVPRCDMVADTISSLGRLLGQRLVISPVESTCHLYQRLAISLWRGNASAWIHRCPQLAPSLDGVMGLACLCSFVLFFCAFSPLFCSLSLVCRFLLVFFLCTW